MSDFVDDAFETTCEIAKTCDMIIAGGATHIAGHSAAEFFDIPYICMPYCPAVIPSMSQPPARMVLQHNMQGQKRPRSVIKSMWRAHQKEQNDWLLRPTNRRREELNLAPIKDVHNYILSERPWLITDKILAPAPKSRSLDIYQAGCMLVNNDKPLSEEIEHFLQNGSAPIYVGFGSTLFAGSMDAQGLIDVCRELKRRVILYLGWSVLEISDSIKDAEDVLIIEEHNQSKLFSRVAAVVHHGGAGTTATAAIAGVPQVAVPNCYDQFYWGSRLKELGIGNSCRNTYSISANALAGTLREVIETSTIHRAKEVSKQIDLDATQTASELIYQMLS